MLARAVRELAERSARSAEADRACERPTDPDDKAAVARLCRQLTAAQQRMIAELDPMRPFNAVRVAPRLSSVRCISDLNLIERGRCGWADARLTRLGRAVQARIVNRETARAD